MQGAFAYLRFQTQPRRFASEARRWFTPEGKHRNWVKILMPDSFLFFPSF